MKEIGKSSLWTEKYRPKTTEDLIAPEKTKRLLKTIVKEGQLPNLLLYGTAGIGKTSAARALINDLGGEELYINGSLETSIDVIRDRVTQFATTHSVIGTGQKVVIIDECERLSANAMDALKVILEETAENCRFIFCTNNLQKIISPLQSRCKLISFNYGKDDSKEIILQYFKRIQFVLKNEGYGITKEEKEILANFCKEFFPDFRKMLNELQGYLKTNEKIDFGLLRTAENSQVGELVELLKSRSFNKMRKYCTEIDPSTFYTSFYNEIVDYIKPEVVPDVVMILAEYGYKHALTIDQEINLVACCTELMKTLAGHWK